MDNNHGDPKGHIDLTVLLKRIDKYGLHLGVTIHFGEVFIQARLARMKKRLRLLKHKIHHRYKTLRHHLKHWRKS